MIARPQLSMIARPRPQARHLALLAGASALAACNPDPGLTVIAPADAVVAVNDTLRLAVGVSNPSGSSLSWRFAGSAPDLDRTARIAGTTSGAEFRWTPLASQVGVHQVTFIAEGGGESSRASSTVEVTTSADAAPSFLRPGAGRSYDLSIDPCVDVEIEVRDDDTEVVDITQRPPEIPGSQLDLTGDKTALFRWCPSQDQIDSSERWTLQLEASDGEHPPVPWDFVIVLRVAPRSDCPGQPPSVTVEAPAPDERVESSSAYEVSITATDDLGIREAPVLYFSRTEPDDPTRLDLSSFELVPFFEGSPGHYSARIELALLAGEETPVFFVVEATDNDDAMGSACDHHTTTPLGRFVAVKTEGGGTLAPCAPCMLDGECASGLCMATSDHGLGCGPPAMDCRTTAACTDDTFEQNDSLAAAAPVTDGDHGALQICPGDSDYFAVDSGMGDSVTVRIDGFDATTTDLDLELLRADGSSLGRSASVDAVETVTACAGGGAFVVAHVLGFLGDQGAYDLHVSRAAGACSCVDDAFEDNDGIAAARPLPAGGVSGTVCAGDSDYFAVTVSGPARIDAVLQIDPTAGDLDLELYAPGGSTAVARSTGVGATETIAYDATASGSYVLRVYGYATESGDYHLDATTMTSTACTGTLTCPIGTVCAGSVCMPDACTATSSCPAMHLCVTAGAAGHCLVSCLLNRDCRDAESCKWLPEGRLCARRGTGLNGARCAGYSECGGQRACAALPGGYCARVGCAGNADCESDTACVMQGGVAVCARKCVAAPDCRTGEGYSCDPHAVVGTASMEFVCLPPS